MIVQLIAKQRLIELPRFVPVSRLDRIPHLYCFLAIVKIPLDPTIHNFVPRFLTGCPVASET